MIEIVRTKEETKNALQNAGLPRFIPDVDEYYSHFVKLVDEMYEEDSGAEESYYEWDIQGHIEELKLDNNPTYLILEVMLGREPSF